ncbi:MAG TPA: helix-hairpin-helix domain-containing protein [Catalimonadaceae bacterium]|nr:helix-hairpin-helix domain-containing protein [Catalimonadaceae bacterium]
MMKRSLLFLLLVLAFVGKAIAQTYPRPEIQVEDFIEKLFNLQSSDANYEDLYEQMLLLYSNPIDLNNASPEELRNTYILSEQQVQQLLLHRQKTGRLLSIYELQSVPSFDLQTIYALLPFAVVNEVPQNQDNKGLLTRIREASNNSLILRTTRTLEQQKGYTDALPDPNGELPKRYLGDKNKLFARYRISHPKDFSLGFTTEKDPGEQVMWSPSKKVYGMDFWSAHLLLENRGIFRKIVFGDYQFMFGQGLVYSAGFAVGKGAEPVNTVRRSSLGLRPYTSVLEGMFFRGAGATMALKNIEITVLGSQKFVDGNIQSSTDTLDTDVSEDFASSINITGFHRTETELASKHSNKETMLTVAAVYKEPTGRYEVGVLGTTVKYEFPIIRRPSIYNQFDFNGNQNQNLSVSGQYNYQNFSFFGEAAASKSGGHAAVAGLVGSLGKGIDVSMVVRDYSRDYHAFYSNGFGEATRNVNEQGIYWGLKYRFHPKWQAAVYYDRFRFPYLSFQSDGPSGGQEYLGRLTYSPSKTVSMFVQYRDETKLRNLSGNTGKTDFLSPTHRQNWVIQADAKANSWLSFRTRVQGSRWHQERGSSPRTGISLSQDLNIDLGKVSISNRFSLFDTDDYNTRQYLYEKNVLYAFSIPALYGRGTRVYSLIQYSPTRKIDIWFRIARTFQKDQKTIGSALEEINANHKTDVVVQLRYNF